MRYLVFAIAAALTLNGCDEPRSLSEEFPGEWQQPTSDVMIALAEKHITGCGEFYQKPAAFASDEYVVACTRDGKTWTVYRVWPRIDEVMGPDPSALWQFGGPPNPN